MLSPKEKGGSNVCGAWEIFRLCKEVKMRKGDCDARGTDSDECARLY